MVERSGAESSGSLSIHSIWIEQNRRLVAVQAALFVQNVPARKPAQLAQGSYLPCTGMELTGSEDPN